MKSGLIVSTHCDDAILSLGGLIHSNSSQITKVVTIFGTCAWSRNEKLKDPSVISKMNRAEEERVWTSLGIDYEINQLPEAMMRGYKIWNMPPVKETALTKKITKIIRNHVDDYINIYLPLGTGKHIDHLLIARQLNEVFNRKTKDQTVWLYEDVPYTWWLKGRCPRLDEIKADYKITPKTYDITDYLKKKEETLLMYETQIGEDDIKMVREYSSSLLNNGYGERVWKVIKKH